MRTKELRAKSVRFCEEMPRFETVGRKVCDLEELAIDYFYKITTG